MGTGKKLRAEEFGKFLHVVVLGSATCNLQVRGEVKTIRKNALHCNDLSVLLVLFRRALLQPLLLFYPYEII